MSLESFIGGLSVDEKVATMELIWQDLVRTKTGYVSPAWHEKVIAERLANPVDGPRLTLDASKAEIVEALHARRAPG